MLTVECMCRCSSRLDCEFEYPQPDAGRITTLERLPTFANTCLFQVTARHLHAQVLTVGDDGFKEISTQIDRVATVS